MVETIITKDFRFSDAGTMCQRYHHGTPNRQIKRRSDDPFCEVWMSDHFYHENPDFNPKLDDSECPGFFCGMCRYYYLEL